jgi:signal transduction histidine kinase
LQQSLEVMEEQSIKLTALIGHLLDISRLESGRLTLVWETVDLVALVQSVIRTTQNATQRHTLTLHASERLSISIDPLRIEQILVNLLDNAMKYSPDGGVIEVDIYSQNNEVYVSVTDPGVGIPPERRARIFERFYQAHGTGHLGGMGLGLYISRQIADLHGGTLTAEFPESGGTRMILRLVTETPG